MTLGADAVDRLVRILLLGMRDDREHPDPPAVRDLVHLLIEVRQARGEFTGVGSRSAAASVPSVQPPSDTGWTPPDDGGRDDELVDQADAARELDMSPKTLRREEKRGHLSMVDTPRGRKVPRGELNRYAADRRRRGR